MLVGPLTLRRRQIDVEYHIYIYIYIYVCVHLWLFVTWASASVAIGNHLPSSRCKECTYNSRETREREREFVSAAADKGSSLPRLRSALWGLCPTHIVVTLSPSPAPLIVRRLTTWHFGSSHLNLTRQIAVTLENGVEPSQTVLAQPYQSRVGKASTGCQQAGATWALGA